ncbi:hypothetical protein ACJX0J_039154 [Zea mays]
MDEAHYDIVGLFCFLLFLGQYGLYVDVVKFFLVFSLPTINILLIIMFSKNKYITKYDMFFAMQGKRNLKKNKGTKFSFYLISKINLFQDAEQNCDTRNGYIGTKVDKKNSKKIAYFVFCCFWATMDFMLMSDIPIIGYMCSNWREIQDLNGVIMQNKFIRKITKIYEGAYFVFCCFWATMDFINVLLIIMSIKISFSDLANCMRVFQIWCLDKE